MNGFHADLTTAVASQHRVDLARAAARSRLIADLPDTDRHQTPRHHPSWRSRATAFLGHQLVDSRI
jgi:hypothetical protein